MSASIKILADPWIDANHKPLSEFATASIQTLAKARAGAPNEPATALDRPAGKEHERYVASCGHGRRSVETRALSQAAQGGQVEDVEVPRRIQVRPGGRKMPVALSNEGNRGMLQLRLITDCHNLARKDALYSGAIP